jgi:hypothetical protein
MCAMRKVHFATMTVSSRAGRVTVALMAGLIATAVLAPAASAVPSQVKRECRDDYKRFCPRYKVGTSRMRSCMRSNGSQLSWGCYQALKDHGYVRR